MSSSLPLFASSPDALLLDAMHRRLAEMRADLLALDALANLGISRHLAEAHYSAAPTPSGTWDELPKTLGDRLQIRLARSLGTRTFVRIEQAVRRQWHRDTPFDIATTDLAMALMASLRESEAALRTRARTDAPAAHYVGDRRLARRTGPLMNAMGVWINHPALHASAQGDERIRAAIVAVWERYNHMTRVEQSLTEQWIARWDAARQALEAPRASSPSASGTRPRH